MTTKEGKKEVSGGVKSSVKEELAIGIPSIHKQWIDGVNKVWDILNEKVFSNSMPSEFYSYIDRILGLIESAKKRGNYWTAMDWVELQNIMSDLREETKFPNRWIKDFLGVIEQATTIEEIGVKLSDWIKTYDYYFNIDEE